MAELVAVAVSTNNMNTIKVNRLIAALARCSLDLVHSNHKLQQEIAAHEAASKAIKAGGTESAKLLEESRDLQNHLHSLSKNILSAHENERHTLSVRLQDEIVQTLAAIQIRLLSLKKVVTVSNADFNKEIAITQNLVNESVKIINRFVKECETPHEN